MPDPQVIYEHNSPHGNARAVVEDDGRVAYLSLYGLTEGDVRSVWVCNHVEAPEDLDVAGMRAGNPPLNPAAHCAHPGGVGPLDPDRLEVIWLESGDGLALYQADLLLAVIPPWSGTKGFDGYSVQAIGTGPLAWELTHDNVLRERFEDARSWWQEWEAGFQPWIEIQQDQMSAYTQRFGEQHKYFAIDVGHWPQKGLAWFKTPEANILTTVGVGMRPMPAL